MCYGHPVQIIDSRVKIDSWRAIPAPRLRVHDEELGVDHVCAGADAMVVGGLGRRRLQIEP